MQQLHREEQLVPAAVRRALELNPDLSHAENLYAHIEVAHTHFMRGAGRMVHYTVALRHLIRGEREESRAAILRQMDIPDPEGRFYVARHLIHLRDTEIGLAALSSVVEDGFFCLPALTRDPWLDGVRSVPAFADIARRAEVRHRRAVISFLSSEGDRVLGVPYPV